jgi:hypothetical protein
MSEMSDKFNQYYNKRFLIKVIYYNQSHDGKIVGAKPYIYYYCYSMNI